MKWELYEVWGEDINGREELIDTTKSLKAAQQIVRAQDTTTWKHVILYRENDDGGLEQVEKVTY